MAGTGRNLFGFLGFLVVATLPAGILLWVVFGQPSAAEPAQTVEAPMSAGREPAPVSLQTRLPAGHPPVSTLRSPHPDRRVPTPLTVAVAYAGAAESLPREAAVLVFVRRPGERMPLVVERFAARELPRSVALQLDNETAGSLELVARLSQHGDVRLDAGDVEVVRNLAGEGTAVRSFSIQIPAPQADASAG